MLERLSTCFPLIAGLASYFAAANARFEGRLADRCKCCEARGGWLGTTSKCHHSPTEREKMQKPRQVEEAFERATFELTHGQEDELEWKFNAMRTETLTGKAKALLRKNETLHLTLDR
ncbi:MAG: hypothetical protein PHY43_08540 [Verrucomicrobiales bacterium]|nr:hypothetical protein [Verrucomicrobiales bacterium]